MTLRSVRPRTTLPSSDLSFSNFPCSAHSLLADSLNRHLEFDFPFAYVRVA